MLSFKANYINSGIVPQRVIFDLYSDSRVSIVEFDTKSSDDRNTIKSVAKDWERIGNTRTFANDMADEFKEVSSKYDNYNQSRFFGLTTQLDSFEKIDSNNVLGLAEVSHVPENRFDESDVFILDYLQTKPDSMFLSRIRNYKKIGISLLQSIISIFRDKPIVLIPTANSKKFYLDHGFEKSPDNLFLILKNHIKI